MDDGERMPKVNIEKESDKLTLVEKEYMNRVYKQNLDRVNRWMRIRRKNRILGTALSFGVISIYSYTMWAIQQESFLDDLNEPDKISNTN